VRALHDLRHGKPAVMHALRRAITVHAGSNRGRARNSAASPQAGQHPCDRSNSGGIPTGGGASPATPLDFSCGAARWPCTGGAASTQCERVHGREGSEVQRAADFHVMPRGLRFVDVLEDMLGAIAWEATPPGEPKGRTAPPRHVVYTPLYNLHTVAREAGCEKHAARAYGSGIRPAVAAPARPVRRLTTAQARSLDALNLLGAGVRAGFSVTELRSAFRGLARRYHPDRHPGASDADRQQLAQQFMALRASYETLLTAIESPPA